VIILLGLSTRPLLFYLANSRTETVLFAQIFIHLDPLLSLAGPASLYYFRSLLKGKLVVDWALLLHLIPALLILVNTLPFYGVPFAEKIQFATQVQLGDLIYENNFPYLLFPYSWHKIFFPLYTVFYGLVAVAFALRTQKNAKLYVKRKVWYLLTRVAWVFGFQFLPLIFITLYSSFANFENAPVSFVHAAYRYNNFLYFFTLILPIGFLLMPKVLYGEKQKESVLEGFRTRIKQFFTYRYPDSIKTSLESEDMELIVSYLEQAKPYLKEDFSQHDISIALNIPQKRITECFNKQLKVSFPLYRNTLRIKHATELFQKGAHLSTSIEGIGALSGFKSKSTFFAAFKSVHGITPVEWIKENL
jgi:AraC-like DNA-binding protein